MRGKPFETFRFERQIKILQAAQRGSNARIAARHHCATCCSVPLPYWVTEKSSLGSGLNKVNSDLL
jgi:hypothetical protein